MDRGAWWATVHRVSKNWIGLQRLGTQHARQQTSEDWRIQDLELKGQGLPEMLRSQVERSFPVFSYQKGKSGDRFGGKTGRGFFTDGFSFQCQSGGLGYLLQGKSKNFQAIWQSSHIALMIRLKSDTMKSFSGCVLQGDMSLPISSQQFGAVAEDVDCQMYPEKGFGAGGSLCRQQDKAKENVGKCDGQWRSK